MVLKEAEETDEKGEDEEEESSRVLFFPPSIQIQGRRGQRRLKIDLLYSIKTIYDLESRTPQRFKNMQPIGVNSSDL